MGGLVSRCRSGGVGWIVHPQLSLQLAPMTFVEAIQSRPNQPNPENFVVPGRKIWDKSRGERLTRHGALLEILDFFTSYNLEWRRLEANPEHGFLGILLKQAATKGTGDYLRGQSIRLVSKMFGQPEPLFQHHLFYTQMYKEAQALGADHVAKTVAETFPDITREVLTRAGDLRTLPSHLSDAPEGRRGLDGFFAARLLRRATTDRDAPPFTAR